MTTTDRVPTPRVGVHLEFADGSGDPTEIIRIAQTVERLGYYSLWTGEHVAFFTEYQSSHPSSKDGVHPSLRRHSTAPARFDPFLLFALIAGVTERVRLGTSVAILPQRHPITVAKMVATLDQLSRGRFDFGVGVGWSSEEFEALGIPFAKRRKLFEESLYALESLWTDDISSYSGEMVSFRNVLSFPKTVEKPYKNVFVGGKGEWCRRIATDHKIYWMPSSISIEELKAGLSDEGISGENTTVLFFPLGSWLNSGEEQPGFPPEQIEDTIRYIRDCADLGISQVVVKLNVSDGSGQGLEDLAEALALNGDLSHQRS